MLVIRAADNRRCGAFARLEKPRQGKLYKESCRCVTTIATQDGSAGCALAVGKWHSKHMFCRGRYIVKGGKE